MSDNFLSKNDSWNLLLFRLILTALITYNFVSGSFSGYIIPANMQYSLLIIFHPYILRIFNVQLTAKQIIWISLGLFLHPLGMTYGLYLKNIQWDAVTHLYGASVLAGLIMSIIWSYEVEEYKDLILGAAIMLTASAIWELFEFFIADHLTVYGFYDTLTDVIYNFVGFSIIWVFGRERLSNVVEGFRNFREQKDFS